MDWSRFGLVVSFALHAGVLTASAIAAPPLNAGSELDSANEMTMMRIAILGIGDTLETDAPRSTVILAEVRDEGATAMGDVDAPSASRHYGVSGPADNADPHIARVVGENPRDFPFAGVSVNPNGADPRAPSAPWGRDEALGNDASSARGNMWGDEIDQAFGAGGLGVAGRSACGCGVAADVAITRFLALDRVDLPASTSTVALADDARRGVLARSVMRQPSVRKIGQPISVRQRLASGVSTRLTR